jgi:hypothetical protein
MALFMQMLAEDEFIWVRECLSVRQAAEWTEAMHVAKPVSHLVLESNR